MTDKRVKVVDFFNNHLAIRQNGNYVLYRIFVKIRQVKETAVVESEGRCWR